MANVNFNAGSWLMNMTRAAMDDQEYMQMLAKSNTALYLMMQDPITQGGSHLQANVVYKRKQARVTSTGTAAYDKTVNPPHVTAREKYARVQLEYAIDGFDFKAHTGVDLEKAAGGEFNRSGMKTLVNAYRNEFLSAQGDFNRDLNNFIVNGGSVDPANQGEFGADRFIGLRNLAMSGATYGGLSASSLGDHTFNDITGNAKQKQWAPVVKDVSGALDLSNGDLDKMMAVLNHGGNQIRPSQAFQARFVGIMSQDTRAMIIGALGDKIRRPISEGGFASTDVSGFRRNITFEEHNLELYVDADVPNGEIIVWNPACIRFAQMDTDTKYVKSWVLSTTDNTAVIPFRKEAQLFCCDLSQIGRLSGITSVTA